MSIRLKGSILICLFAAGWWPGGMVGARAQMGAAGGSGTDTSAAGVRRTPAGAGGAAGVGSPMGAADDLDLIRSQTFSSPDEFAHYHGKGNNDKALQSRQSNAFARYNPVTLVLKGALLGYQKLVSEQLARSCPYEISCSNFSKQAIHEFGIFKGVFISADRILRCNRIGVLDISPVRINPVTGAIIDSPNMYR